jgi:adenylate cyclase
MRMLPRKGLFVGLLVMSTIGLLWGNELFSALPGVTVLALFLLLGGVYWILNRRQQERNFLYRIFEPHVHSSILKKLLAHPDTRSVSAEKQLVSVLFMDLEGFTVLSEAMEAEPLARFMNRYLTTMTDVILSEQGTLDKYVGDAVIAFWNAPLPDSHHAARAIRTALTCQQSLKTLNEEIFEQYGFQLRMRCGIHTAEACVGNFGSQQRVQYTLLGDAPNLAARLEAANKIFGTQILVSEESYRSARENMEISFREIASIQVRGRKEAVRIFEPLFPKIDQSIPESYEEALKLFQQTKILEADMLSCRLTRWLSLIEKEFLTW